MTDQAKIIEFRCTTPKPDGAERTITLSYAHTLLLLEAFTQCAEALRGKLRLLDELYAVLPGHD